MNDNDREDIRGEEIEALKELYLREFYNGAGKGPISKEEVAESLLGQLALGEGGSASQLYLKLLDFIPSLAGEGNKRFIGVAFLYEYHREAERLAEQYAEADVRRREEKGH